jgi:hypothetical protein
MYSAESLTSSPASIFWLTVGLVILTIPLVAVAVFQWRSDRIRKRLLLTFTSRSDLLSLPKSMREDLETQFKGGSIDGKLYVTVIELSNAGKTPIRSNDFDQNRSLQFTIDTRIIKLLSTEHTPTSAPFPEFTAVEKTFSLKPELITRSEVIKVALLTAGRPTQVRALVEPFGDVDVEIGNHEKLLAKRNLRDIGRIVPVIISVIAACVAFVAGFVDRIPAVSNLTVTIAGDCDKSIGDSATALFTLQTLGSQTSTLEAGTSNPSTSIKFYEQTLTLARKEFITLNKDYHAFTPSKSVTSMITSTNKATSIIEKALNPISVQTIVNLSDELPAVEKGFSSPSTIHSLCKDGDGSVQVNSESVDVSGNVQVRNLGMVVKTLPARLSAWPIFVEVCNHHGIPQTGQSSLSQ